MLLELKKGKKITHEYFISDEWMKLDNEGDFLFEDDVVIDQTEFWEHRRGKYWETGWSVYSEKTTTPKID